MYVIGIDPGPTPGIVRLQVNSSPANPTPMIERADIVQCSDGVLVPVLNALIDFAEFSAGGAVLAYERFVVGRRAARSSSAQAGAVTRDVVGVLDHWAKTSVRSTYARSASEVKPWATDTRLAAAGLLDLTKGMRHARDAARHALYCAVRDCGLADPLSRKAGAK